MITKLQIQSLLLLCMDINSLNARTKERTGDLPAVFFKFHGHVGCVEINIYEHGWYKGAVEYKTFNIYCEPEYLGLGDKYETVFEYLSELKKKDRRAGTQ